MGDPGFVADQFDQYLREFLLKQTVFLKQLLAIYVIRMHASYGEVVSVVVDEVFHDTLLEIIAHQERFMSMQEPRAWFLAVSMNVLKRRRARFAKRERFEILLSDLWESSASGSEADLLDQLTGKSVAGPEDVLETSEQVRSLLSLVSSQDAQVLDLAVLRDLDSTTVANQLGISPPVVRLRLHRALGRLRRKLQGYQANQKEERE